MQTANRGLSVRSISKRYGDLLAVDDVSFDIGRQELLAVVGPSGCGKSTLLEIIAGLKQSTSGQVVLGAEEITTPHPDMGIVFQQDSTLPWRRVLDNVTFPLQMIGHSRAQRNTRAEEVLDLVGLLPFAHMYPYQLSGGMRQRVSIARMLVTDPLLLLMDEPFGALDEQTRLVLGLEVQRIVKQTSAPTLLITHSIQEAVLLADKVLVMTGRPGRIAMEVDIPLEQPRTSETLASPVLASLVARVWDSLKDEAELQASKQ